MTLKADAGFLIDTGAEKVFIVDEKGGRVPNDIALLMVAQAGDAGASVWPGRRAGERFRP